MAETTTKTTTPRARGARAASTTRTAAAKPAASKATPAKAATPAKEETADDIVKVAFVLPAGEETKRYQKFDVKFDVDGNSTGCVGTVYAPPGTVQVKVQLAGPADVVDPE